MLDVRSAVLRDVAQALDPPTFRMWIEPVTALDWDGRTLVLGAPSRSCSWLRDRFGRVLSAAAEHAIGAERVTIVDAAAYDPADTDDPGVLVAGIAARDHLRIPTDWLAHYPVERDPHAHVGDWRGEGIRAWDHVQGSVRVDHVSRPRHLRALLGVAACLQGGIGADHVLTVDPRELLRAAGVDPGGSDVLDLLRTLADWHACDTLTVTLAAQPNWNLPERTVIDGPPLVGPHIITTAGELLTPRQALDRKLGSPDFAALHATVRPSFVAAVADDANCRLVSCATLRAIGRELTVYARWQALTPEKRSASGDASSEPSKVLKRYGHPPWLHQLGLHGQPAATDSPAAARRRSQWHRGAEVMVRDDLLSIAAVDSRYAWVTEADAGNGAAVVRVGLRGAERRRSHASSPEPAVRSSRRLWHRAVMERGDFPARRHISTARQRARIRAAKAIVHPQVTGSPSSPPRRSRREPRRLAFTVPPGQRAHDG